MLHRRHTGCPQKCILFCLVSGLMVSGLLSCGHDLGGSETPCPPWSGHESLAVHSEWAVVPLQEDPFHDISKADPAVCGPGRYGSEEGGGTFWFGIDTIDCAYITVTQPLLQRLCPGDVVSLRLWHFSLTGASDGYQVALAFDASVPDIMETILVPRPGMLLERAWIVDRHITSASPVLFHLSNHGINSWGLLDVTAQRQSSSE